MKREREDYRDPILIYDTEANDSRLEEYLDLCRFVMNDASAHCRGLFLRGSSLYYERAIKLLSGLNYDYELAKLHILFPTRMMIPETRSALEEMVREQRASIKLLIEESVSELRETRQETLQSVIDDFTKAIKEPDPS